MKKTFVLLLLFATSITGIHAQESAFEVLMPYSVDFLNASFCRETPDGHFLVVPGSDCKILKLLAQDGKVVDEMTYVIDSVNDSWTWFGQLIDIPDDPTHYLAVAEYYDEVDGTHNKFHVIKIDENLSYNPDEVIVVDLSEEVKHFWIESEPHWVIDEEGNLCFATVAMKWDDTYCLMYVKVSPEGETTVVYDPRSYFEDGGEVCAFARRGDHYVMLAGFRLSNNVGYMCQYDVSLDFVSDSIRRLNDATGLLLYDNLQDSCIFATWEEGISGFTPVWLDDDVFLLPTKVYGYSHYSMSGEHNGVAVWKVNADGELLDRIFLDVFDTNSLGMKLEYFYNTLNPLLVHGNDVYLCYTPRGNGFSVPLRTVVCKLDTELNLKWKRWYGAAFDRGVATGMSLTSDGGLLVSGYGGPYAPHVADAYVLKITSDGYCSVKENEEPLLKPYCLFPNPVDDILRFEFSPDVTPQTVEIHDIQGRLIRSQSSGLESIDMSLLPAGTYTVRLVMKDGGCYCEKVMKL